jgi:hypothetical protein
MYLEVITSEAISDERKHKPARSIVLNDELFISAVMVDSIALGKL